MPSDDGEFLAVGLGVGAAELGVEVGGVVGHVGEGVVDLVEAALRLGGMLVFERDSAAPAEGHLPEAVQAVVRVDGDGQGADLGEMVFQVAFFGCPRHGKEVRQGRLDRGLFLVVPVHAQDEVAADRPGDPDALNRARSLDIGQLEGLARFNPDGGTALPAEAQMASRAVGIGFGSGAAAAFPTWVFRGDGAGLRRGQAGQVA